jgi:hypothetical protein
MSSIEYTGHPVQYVDKADYARIIERSERVVERYLAGGRIPGAIKDERGKWIMPADAQPTSSDVVPLNPPSGPSPIGVLDQLAAPGPRLYTLEEYAEKLGTSVGGVRRLGDAGLITVGPFGFNGALRVFVP